MSIKSKKNILVIFSIIQIGCYQMKPYSYLFIDFKDSRIDSRFFKMYIDSIFNKNLSIPDSVRYIFLSGEKLSDRERIIHFNNKPDEWCMINFTVAPCLI